ncbi:hypothetical protein ABAC460_21950 [Asticcacaulis sp. AC460]|uniref:ankyrin repeat domain-containing protein n=1 Tax=Asticcacaulis sp. AC460 TaxID=1282360 RepID=UPI0003C3B97A|nr:ankyrin repeat domain-containing protein [Asticcacaulis sp. AC460]ESQ86884.1 hypothetical protein ABAC460_21950 [Asticcacaulis sp. AC460]
MTQQVQFNPKISASIRSRDISAFRHLLKAEPEQITAYTPFAGGTWLHYAAFEGDIEAAQHLLTLGVDANVGDKREGRGAICDACLGGHEEIVRLLLNNDCRLDTSDPVRNPLFSAIVGRSLPIARLLLERGIDPLVQYNGPSMKEMDAAAFALERGEIEIAEEIARWRAKGKSETARQILDDARRRLLLNYPHLPADYEP